MVFLFRQQAILMNFLQLPDTEVPLRYIPQIQAGMAVTNSPTSLFVSYSNESTSVFICKQNSTFFEKLLSHLQNTFIEGKRAIRNSDLTDIKTSIHETSREVEFLAEVKSVEIASDSESLSVSDVNGTSRYSETCLNRYLSNPITWLFRYFFLVPKNFLYIPLINNLSKPKPVYSEYRYTFWVPMA